MTSHEGRQKLESERHPRAVSAAHRIPIRHGGEGVLREVFDGAQEGIFVLDENGICIDVNSAGCRLLGEGLDDLVGRSLVASVAAGDQARELSLRSTLHQERGAAELPWRRKDGTDVLVALTSIELSDGCHCAFALDVGACRNVERRLRLSESWLAGIVELSEEAIISLDEDRRILLFNRGAERIFGHRRAEVVGGLLDVLIPERLREEHRRRVSAIARGRGVVARSKGIRRLSTVGLRKNGEEFPAEVAISRLSVGGETHVTVTVHDVSDHVRAERVQRLLAEIGESLLVASSDYRRLLIDVADAVVRTVADWCMVDLVEAGEVHRLRIAHADPAKAAICDELARYPVDEWNAATPGATVGERSVSMPEVSPAYLESIARNPEHLRTLQAFGARSFVAAPLVVRGEMLGTLTIGSSRTGRRFGPPDADLAEQVASRVSLAVSNARLHEALERSVRARDEMLAIVAHDLRSPLNGLVLEATFVKRHPLVGDSSAGVALAETVLRGAKRMSRLIQDLLDVARVESGGLALARRAMSVDAVLAEAEEAQRRIAADAGVDLVREPADRLPPIWADGERLLQVFGNLIGNALKFTPRGGRVTLSATLQGGQVVFRVRDTGPGIALAALPHVFDRFWQARRTDRRGAGLGLAIAKGIVEAHGGRIAVESEPGVGTTFLVGIPVARAGVASE
jgi:PAS domain S-box-containing protein